MNSRLSTFAKRFPTVALLATVLSLAFASTAFAEKNGIKFGDARLHPYFDLESRYDSAAAMLPHTGASSTGDSTETTSDLLLHFRPGLKLDMPSPTFAVALDGNVDYVLYTGADNTNTRDYSHVAGEGDLSLQFNRDGQLGLEIGDKAMRSDRISSTPSIVAGVISFANDARIKLGFRPAGGSLLIEPSYHLATEVFSRMGSNAEVDPSYNNYISHVVSLNGRWKFLPKTAITVDSQFLARSYMNDGAQVNGTLIRGTPINVLSGALGLAGLVTTHVSTVLRLGWAADLKENSFSTLIAQAEVSYLLTEFSSVRAGYSREYVPSGPPYVSYGDDRFYLEGRLQMAGDLTVHVTGTVDLLAMKDQDGTNQRKDTALGIDTGFDFQLRPWVKLGAGYLYTYRESDQDVLFDQKSYSRNEAYARIQLVY